MPVSVFLPMSLPVYRPLCCQIHVAVNVVDVEVALPFSHSSHLCSPLSLSVPSPFALMPCVGVVRGFLAKCRRNRQSMNRMKFSNACQQIGRPIVSSVCTVPMQAACTTLLRGTLRVSVTVNTL